MSACEEKIKSVMGGERERLDYIILLNNIYYFNELNRKIKIKMSGVL